MDAQQAIYRDGMAYDEADAHLASSDPVMAQLVHRYGPIAPPDVDAPPDLFGALIMAIVRQQLATAAATAIYGRLLHYFGDHVPTRDALLRAGPDLRSTAGLSHAKERALRSLAERIQGGQLDLDRLPSPAGRGGLPLADLSAGHRGMDRGRLHDVSTSSDRRRSCR
jgi:DNA-3-methyladenine glycosylase II